MNSATANPAANRTSTLLHKKHNSLVGIDSDGCVFDTMGIKQRRHFVPFILKFWSLGSIAPQVIKLVEELNLFSRHRGRNRFLNIALLFERLAQDEAVKRAGIKLPDMSALQRYCQAGVPLGNETLAAEVARSGDAELAQVLAWSRALNDDIDANMPPVPPFAGVRETLELMARSSDLVVISQTPKAALIKEWRLHGLDDLVNAIAGQEDGSKSEQLDHAHNGAYARGKSLMLGDALGDLETARDCHAHFFPIIPGSEEQSWQQLRNEGYSRFLNGTFGGEYAEHLITHFCRALGVDPAEL